MKLLVLMNVFYNFDMVERTIQSILQNKGVFELKMIFLENPSIHSKKMLELSTKYNIEHYKCNDNIEGSVFQLFYNNHKDLINEHDIICLTESDVVLDDGCISEALNIIEKLNVGSCNVALKTNLEKYKSIQSQINAWVPTSTKKEFYAIGNTGIQFILMRKDHFINYFEAINQKKIRVPIARGSTGYYGFSDSSLHLFNRQCGFTTVQTINNKLDHIGWEASIGLHEDYRRLKDLNLNSGKIRQNINISNYYFEKLN